MFLSDITFKAFLTVQVNMLAKGSDWGNLSMGTASKICQFLLSVEQQFYENESTLDSQANTVISQAVLRGTQRRFPPKYFENTF